MDAAGTRFRVLSPAKSPDASREGLFDLDLPRPKA